jgi:aldehyde:ferredoxin oxidoreductase
MFGYCGRILIVDLTRRQTRVEALPEAVARAVVGGIGLGTWLLHRWAPRGVDPLAPENPVIFVASPFVGTGLTTSAKYALVTKSPLTGFIGDSLSSSHLALSLKAAGWDAVVITGAANAPTAVVVDAEGASFLPADNWWGLQTPEAEAAVEAALGGSAHAAVIGPAGEAGVRYATVTNDGRHAGRGGAGAVMGAKRLKAVAFSAFGAHNAQSATHKAQGTNPHPALRLAPCALRFPRAADPAALRAAAVALARRSQGPETAKYRVLGTAANLLAFDRLGTLPTLNFQQSTFEGAERISGERLLETRKAGRSACASCTIGCEQLFRMADGSGRRLEYETMFALGPLLGVDDPDTVLEAAALCDRLGMDTISAGGTLAWAMECVARGVLTESELGGVPLRFGSAEGVREALTLIAGRAGIGALLAEGSRAAAARLGRGSAYWAMHVKGLELPGYEPRSLKTMALGLATSPRGACHNRSAAYEADLSGRVDRLTVDASRGRLAAESEDFAAVLDSLILCKFLRRCFDDFYPEAAALLRHVTGWEMTDAELRRVGERITNLKKAFNLREGWQPADDTLPPRLLDEPLPTGPTAGVALTRDELATMIDAYYAARGWSPDGRISESKWRDLDLTELIGDPQHTSTHRKAIEYFPQMTQIDADKSKS